MSADFKQESCAAELWPCAGHGSGYLDPHNTPRRGCYFMVGRGTRDKETPDTVNTVPQAGSANRDWTQAAWLQAHSSKNWKWMCFLQENGHRMWENLSKKCVAWESSSVQLLFLLPSVWGPVGLKITLLMNGKGLLCYYYEESSLNLMILLKAPARYHVFVRALLPLYFWKANQRIWLTSTCYVNARRIGKAIKSLL